jgi:hypothetical protein
VGRREIAQTADQTATDVEISAHDHKSARAARRPSKAAQAQSREVCRVSGPEEYHLRLTAHHIVLFVRVIERAARNSLRRLSK